MAFQNRAVRAVFWLLILIAAIGGFALYNVIGPNTGKMDKGEFLYIRTGSTYDDVKTSLKDGGFVRSMWSFDMLAKRAGYPAKVKAGKYRIKPGMSNINIVRMLRNGTQVPVKLVINKLRTKQDLAGLVGRNLEADSVQFLQLLNDDAYLAASGFDNNTAMAAIIPDTYEFWWNTSADKTFKKLSKYYDTYWTDARKKQAEAKGLDPMKVMIIASIVEEETNKNDEKGNIASVYINRLKTGMPLQADPTVKFAAGDFAIRRVTGAHTQSTSPYNTYKYRGLPPGPICTPSKKTIEAVLNAPDTKYIYFCAREDFSGYHSFASNYAEHMKNAQRYQKALNERNIH